MGTYFQAAAMVLVASVLGLVLSKQGKEMSAMLTIGVCSMVIIGAIAFLKPVLDLLRQLEALGNINAQMVQILFKVVCIGLISEIAAMICADAGSASMGKALQILGSAVVLWLSIPVFQTLLELIQQIIGGL